MKEQHVDRKVYEAARQVWTSQVQEISDSGYYKNEAQAERWFIDNIAPIWRSALRLGNVDAQTIVKDLGINKTQMLVLHLIGVGVLHKQKPRRAKLLRSGAPYISNGRLYSSNAVPKGDIAKMIGRSDSSVDYAISCFRGTKGKAGDRLYRARLLYPAPFPSGILFDGSAFDRQLTFEYVYEIQDYDQISSISWRSILGSERTYSKARQWADDAKKAMSSGPSITKVRKQTERAHETTLPLYLGAKS